MDPDSEGEVNNTRPSQRPRLDTAEESELTEQSSSEDEGERACSHSRGECSHSTQTLS